MQQRATIFRLALCLLTAGGCGDPDVTILAQGLPATVAEGQSFEHKFTVQPPLDGGAFLTCAGEDELTVHEDGTATLPVHTAGQSHELCIAYRNRDGGTVARHKFTVTVGPRAQVVEGDFRPPVATHRKQLRALAISAKSVQPKAGSRESCEGALAVDDTDPLPYTTYDGSWVLQALDLEAPDYEAQVLLGPPEPLRATLTKPERPEDSRSIEEMKRPYAVMIMPSRVVVPTLVVPEEFAVGQQPSFEPGEYRGTIHVANLQTGAILCSRSLVFASTSAVRWTEWREEGDFSKSSLATMRSALWVDFAEQGARASQAAIAAMAPGLIGKQTPTP